MNKRGFFFWIVRIVPAVIFIQSLFFKFSGAKESLYIFNKIGMPEGRIGSAVVELVASVILIFIPRFAWLGALIGWGTVTGAIYFHLTSLGVEVLGDHGLLFGLAVTNWVCCALVMVMQRERLPLVGSRARPSS